VSIGVSTEHRELAASLTAWAAGLGGLDSARAAEEQAGATFDEIWAKVVDQGVPTIALPEAVGGGGGSVLDAAVALEACARVLLPGALLSTTVGASLLGESPVADALVGGARVAVALDPTLSVTDRVAGTVPVVLDAPGVDWFLLGGRDADGVEQWYAVPSDAVRVEPSVGLDLTRRAGAVTVDVALTDAVAVPTVFGDLVRRTFLTYAAAEAAGVAQWCLETAVAYAKVREQFGQPIGRFQAIKQLCAGMLETTEAVTATAWDAASAAGLDTGASAPCSTTEAGEQWAFAADVAGTVALDGAVRVAQDCIQVLGGIGFTFEHEAHFYLRRAVALRSLLGSGERHARSLAARARDGVRRKVAVDLEGRDIDVRAEIRPIVRGIAAQPEAERRGTLVEHGLIAPHWPAPYGRDAGPVEQLVIDEELAAAGVTLPDLKIGGWAVPTILAHGTDAQRQRFVEPTLRGDVIWCQLFSEPGAGSDLASLRTRATRVESGWELTGQKVWTSLARQAHWAICLARTNPDAPQHAGITYFLVDMTTPGIEIRPLRELTGDALFNEVFLDGVFVPDELVVGEVDGGWKLARTTLANERVAMAGTKLGVSTERAVELVTDDADLTRVGQLVAISTVCLLLDVRTTLRTLAGQGPGPESSVAKLLTVRTRQDASELVVDLHGPRALLGDDDVRRDVHETLLTRCLSIAGGTTQILRNVAAERILGLPR
jgi:alkylation response protein AidB-like acyl-CoA dehydrogenase